MQLEENTLVADRFRLSRMIGRGGMGSVWRAFDTRLDTPCAVKFIEGELANLAEAQVRFQREAKAAAQLRSPHVVEIKDHGVWDGRPYIAMELLDGEDLGQALVEAGGKLPPMQVSAIVQQLCRALTKAHAAGIVHRDLKPGNVFLVHDDDRKLVKILDFGIAKQASQGLDGSNTRTGAMLGTPYYMSPEQAQGIKSVDARSDLWSLAVIVYQCITGELPFQSEALGDLLVKIIVGPIPVPSAVAPVPPGFDAWWARAAERAPERRFQSAKELGTALELVCSSAATEIGMRAPPLHATAAMPPSSPALRVTPDPGAPFATPSGQLLAAPSYPTPPGIATGGAGHASSPEIAAPATFSGIDAPAVVPRRGPPIAILGGVVAVMAVGIGLGAVALSRRAPAIGGPAAPAKTSHAAASAASEAPSVTETAPRPSASVAAVEETEDVEPASGAAPSASASAIAKSANAPRATAAKAQPPTAEHAATTSAAPAKNAATASAAPAKKGMDLGF